MMDNIREESNGVTECSNLEVDSKLFRKEAAELRRIPNYLVMYNKPLEELDIPEGTRYIYKNFYIGDELPHFEDSMKFIITDSKMVRYNFPEEVYTAIKELIEDKVLLKEIFEKKKKLYNISIDRFKIGIPSDFPNGHIVVENNYIIDTNLDVKSCEAILRYIDTEYFNNIYRKSTTTFDIASRDGESGEHNVVSDIFKKIFRIYQNIVITKGFKDETYSTLEIVGNSKTLDSLTTTSQTKYDYYYQSSCNYKYIGEPLGDAREVAIIKNGKLLDYSLDLYSYLRLVKLIDIDYYNNIEKVEYSNILEHIPNSENKSLLTNIVKCINDLLKHEDYCREEQSYYPYYNCGCKYISNEELKTILNQYCLTDDYITNIIMLNPYCLEFIRGLIAPAIFNDMSPMEKEKLIYAEFIRDREYYIGRFLQKNLITQEDVAGLKILC